MKILTEMVVFNQNLPLQQMVQVKLLTCCCGWVPCITVPVHWYVYQSDHPSQFQKNIASQTFLMHTLLRAYLHNTIVFD